MFSIERSSLSTSAAEEMAVNLYRHLITVYITMPICLTSSYNFDTDLFRLDWIVSLRDMAEMALEERMYYDHREAAWRE